MDEVEARNEEFPMTRAFLQLMDTLTDSPIPAGLGVGLRAPGFQPYLEFLREHIFLKFNTREYKDKGEKVSQVHGFLYRLSNDVYIKVVVLNVSNVCMTERTVINRFPVRFIAHLACSS